MKIGDIDVSNAIINLEHDVSVMQQYINFLVQKNPSLIAPKATDMEEFKQVSLKKLNAKYPKMGIK